MIVGVGAGPSMLTQEAIKTISEASLIYGSERAIKIAGLHIKSECSVHIIENYKKLRELPDKAVILSTGDPMLSGLGYLKGHVIPGISSMQVACARLRISQLEMTPITLHGRSMDAGPLDRIIHEIRSGRCVFLLTDGLTDLVSICSRLEKENLSRDVAVLTELGYPEEKIKLCRTTDLLEAPGLSCVVVGDFSKRI